MVFGFFFFFFLFSHCNSFSYVSDKCEIAVSCNSSAQPQASGAAFGTARLSLLRLLPPTARGLEGTGGILVLPNFVGLCRARQPEPPDFSPAPFTVLNKTCLRSPRPQLPTYCLFLAVSFSAGTGSTG